MPKTLRVAGKVFALGAIATMFLVMPSVGTTSGEPGLLGVQDACAQTGSCLSSPGDICFVNGNAYYERRWEDGGTELE